MLVDRIGGWLIPDGSERFVMDLLVIVLVRWKIPYGLLRPDRRLW